MGLNKISIKAKLTLLCGLFVVGLLAVGLLSLTTINEVKIGGASYSAISAASSIDSDVSPPTGYLLGARVLVFQMLEDGVKDPALMRDLQGQFEEQRKEFEDLHDHYLKTMPEGSIKDLMQKAYAPGHQYLEVAETRFIPLLTQGKIQEANVVRTEMKTFFLAHAAANKTFDETNIALVASLEKQAVATSAARVFTLMAAAVAVIGVVLALCIVIARGILLPLKATMEMLREVARNNLSHRLTVTGTDEIAQMGNALNETVENFSRVMSAIGSDARILTDASEELSTSSQQLGTTSQQTTTQAAAVSAAAEEVSQNVQTVSTATEQMSASIKEISKNASEAAEVASSAARLAGTTNATMTKLSESSAEIGNVIKVITSIAEQTNLLALNATIEAARAGEAGKGFAVVANEVKELAKETAKATEDIGAKVEAIQNDAKGAVQAIDEITAVIGRINDIQNTIASAVEEQTGTTNEIARNISETAKGSSDIASNITGVANATSDTQNSAAASLKSAQELSKLAVRLHGVVSQFQIAGNGHVSRAPAA